MNVIMNMILDIDTLIIRQNEPGGVFVAIRDDGDFGGGDVVPVA